MGKENKDEEGSDEVESGDDNESIAEEEGIYEEEEEEEEEEGDDEFDDDFSAHEEPGSVSMMSMDMVINNNRSPAQSPPHPKGKNEKEIVKKEEEEEEEEKEEKDEKENVEETVVEKEEEEEEEEEEEIEEEEEMGELEEEEGVYEDYEEDFDAPDSPPRNTSLTSLSSIPSLIKPTKVTAAVADFGDELDDLYEFDGNDAPASSPQPAAVPTNNSTPTSQTTATPVVIDWSPTFLNIATSLLNSTNQSAGDKVRVRSIDYAIERLKDPAYKGTSFLPPSALDKLAVSLPTAISPTSLSLLSSSSSETADAMVTRLHTEVVYDRINEILASLHSLRHQDQGQGQGQSRGGDSSSISLFSTRGRGLYPTGRFSKLLVAQSMPLDSEHVMDYVMRIFNEEQRSLSDVISGRKHSLEMVRMSTVEEVEEKWEEEMIKVADSIVDVILARCLVDTAQALL